MNGERSNNQLCERTCQVASTGEHRLFVAAQLPGNHCRSSAAVGGQQNLAAAQHKGVRLRLRVG